MTAAPNQQPRNVALDYAAIQFVVQQLVAGMATATIVRVMACTNEGGVVPVGTVDVQLLVDQITGDGETIPHGTVFRAPYSRMQGGTNAVILDPQPGDLGVCVFASRDISAIKTDPDAARNRAPVPGAPPASRRTFSLSDALYVGGLLNGVPVQFVQFNAEGIRIVSPTLVRVEAPQVDIVAAGGVVNVEAPTINLKGDVAQTDGNVTMSGTLDVQGNITTPAEVTAGNIGLKTHKHPTAPTGPVSPPIP
jgi:hypothetical protein